MSRHYLGVDIGPSELSMAVLQRGRPQPRLAGMHVVDLPDTLELSARQPNVRDADRFVAGLKRGIQALGGVEQHIALSLPDRCGRIFLTEIETPFKSRREGIDILKWQLKSSLPAPPSQVALDFQLLDKREDNRRHCIVAAIARPVLEQYESLVAQAGCRTARIDFHSLHLYNAYRPRIAHGNEFVLVTLEPGLLGLFFVNGPRLEYRRVRACAPDPQQLFLELNRTLVEAVTSFPAIRRCTVFAAVDPELEENADELLLAAFDRPATMMSPALERYGYGNGPAPSGSLMAALNAAERMI